MKTDFKFWYIRRSDDGFDELTGFLKKELKKDSTRETINEQK